MGEENPHFGEWSKKDTTKARDGGKQMKSKTFDWYIVKGLAGKLCVVPESLIEGREIIKAIKCTGLLDAVRKLQKFERKKPWKRKN